MSAISFLLFVPPIVLSIGFLWLMFRIHGSYEDCKKKLVDSVGAQDAKTLEALGWQSRGYVRAWETFAVWSPGWKSVGEDYRCQMQDLQRVVIRGLPSALELPEETRISARRFRRYFCALFVVGALAVFLPAYLSLSNDLAERTGISASVWYVLFGLCTCSLVFLPVEKFKKWPAVEDTL